MDKCQDKFVLSFPFPLEVTPPQSSAANRAHHNLLIFFHTAGKKNQMQVQVLLFLNPSQMKEKKNEKDLFILFLKLLPSLPQTTYKIIRTKFIKIHSSISIAPDIPDQQGTQGCCCLFVQPECWSQKLHGQGELLLHKPPHPQLKAQ